VLLSFRAHIVGYSINTELRGTISAWDIPIRHQMRRPGLRSSTVRRLFIAVFVYEVVPYQRPPLRESALALCPLIS
jgi:hypothetical protein